MNILFTCAGRRYYLIEYFQKSKPPGGVIIGVDMHLTAPAMSNVDKKYIVPAVNSPNYIDVLTNICRKENIAAIISLNDLELPILSNNIDHFRTLGVKAIVSNKDVIDICFDKWKTKEFAVNLGIDTPKTYLNFHEAQKAIDKGELQFPLVIKPRWGSASIGIEFPNNQEEFELSFKLLSKKLFHSILKEASQADVENAILIQEKINGTEYGLDIFNDLSGNFLTVYVKEKLSMRAGETDKAVLRENSAIESIGVKIGKNLKHIGNLDCDIFLRDGKFYFLEMNPRFGGGYPFSHMSGANFPAAIYAMLKNEPLLTKWFKKKYNQIYAKCDKIIPV